MSLTAEETEKRFPLGNPLLVADLHDGDTSPWRVARAYRAQTLRQAAAELIEQAAAVLITSSESQYWVDWLRAYAAGLTSRDEGEQ